MPLEHELQEDGARTTLMLHFSCGSCEMFATVVDTPSALTAWSDHMDTHSDPLDFRTWAWEATQLPFERSTDY